MNTPVARLTQPAETCFFFHLSLYKTVVTLVAMGCAVNGLPTVSWQIKLVSLTPAGFLFWQAITSDCLCHLTCKVASSGNLQVESFSTQQYKADQLLEIRAGSSNEWVSGLTNLRKVTSGLTLETSQIYTIHAETGINNIMQDILNRLQA